MATISWIQYTERVVGRNHPSFQDVVNRPLRQVLTAFGLNPDADISAPFADADHEHDAAAVTSGQFVVARIPDLDAAKITSGVFAPARLGSGAAANTFLDGLSVFRALLAADIPALDAAKIASGVLAPARLGSSPGAGKFLDGLGAFRILAAGDIPDLAASKITSGQFAMARLASGTPDGTKFVRDDGTLAVPSGGGGGTTVDIEDEGSPEGAADTINFTGAGVSVAFGGGVATVSIPGGGGGGSFAPVVDVSGLAGDGTTDDTTALNALLAANPDDVVFDGGGLTYKITALDFPTMNRVVFRNFNFTVPGDTVPISASGLVYDCRFENIFIVASAQSTPGRRIWDITNFALCTFRHIRTFGVDAVSVEWGGKKNAGGSAPYYNTWEMCYGGTSRNWLDAVDDGSIATGLNADTFFACRIQPSAGCTAIKTSEFSQNLRFIAMTLEGPGNGYELSGLGHSIRDGYMEGLGDAVVLTADSIGCVVDFPYFSSCGTKITDNGTDNIVFGHRDDLGTVVDNITGVGGGGGALDDLTDVDTTGEADNDILQRIGGIYVPRTRIQILDSLFVRPTRVQSASISSNTGNITLGVSATPGNLLIWMASLWNAITAFTAVPWTVLYNRAGVSNDGLVVLTKPVTTETTSIVIPYAHGVAQGQNACVFEIANWAGLGLVFPIFVVHEFTGTVQTLVPASPRNKSLIVGMTAINSNNDSPTIAGATALTAVAGTSTGGSPRQIRPFEVDVEKGASTITATYAGSRVGNAAAVVLAPGFIQA